MSQQSAVKMSSFDYLKWLVVLVLVVLSVVGNIHFDAYSSAIRAAAIIVVTIVALLVAVSTNHGAVAWRFLKDARMEMRKVVWPTRQETIQMTLIVAVIVIITALLLWAFDSIFALIISNIVT